MERATTLVRVAWRNLRRQARRSALTAAAMIVGGGLLIFSLSLGDGAHDDWIDSGVRTNSGHVAIEAPDFQRTRKIEDRLPASARGAAERALREPSVAEHIRAAVPRLEVGGLASSPAGARPTGIVGVDPSAEARFSILDEKLIEGRYLEPGDRLAAYVGAGLVNGLELELGSRLVLTAQDAGGQIAGQLVRVVGVFKSGIPEVDESVIHIPLTTAAAWLGTDGDVTSIAVLLESHRRVPEVVRALRRDLSDRIEGGQVRILRWQEAMPELDAGVRIDNLGNYVWQVIVFGIIALAIVNTILMSVMHRHREFGLLQALGLTRRETGSLVVVEGLMLTTLSGLLGVALGLALTWLLLRDGLDISFTWSEEWSFSGIVMDPVIYPAFRAARVIQSLIFIFVIGTLASIYPAWRATRIDVAESMKFER